MVNDESPIDAPITSPPSPGEALSAPSTGRPARRIWPLIVLAAILGVAGAGGMAGLYFYDKATEPDRSTPAVVVDQFLQAALVDQDAVRLGLFTCARWSPSSAMEQLTTGLDPTIRVSWGDLTTRPDGKKAVVRARVQFTVVGVGAGQRLIETWQLELEDDSGWRVCGVTKEQSLNP